jgi:hypothetical protein
MWQKVTRDDFSKLAGRDRRFTLSNADGDYYHVCEDYELQPNDASRDDILSYRIRPKYEDDSRWSIYQPLDDTPDLFLRFAQLYNQERTAETALAWIRQYGSLETEHPGNPEPIEETLGLFFQEVDRAAGTLAMYESVLNHDSDAAEQVTCHTFRPLTEPYLEEFWEGPKVSNDIPGYLGLALITASFEVSKMVERFVRLSLSVSPGVPSPSRVHAYYGFYSLLGAMYLQMFWVMESSGTVTRCQYCGKAIFLSRPNPGGRKRRTDRRFCNDACRQAHHRHKKR